MVIGNKLNDVLNIIKKVPIGKINPDKESLMFDEIQMKTSQLRIVNRIKNILKNDNR